MGDRFLKAIVVLLLPGLLALSGCTGRHSPREKPHIGVTTSWLECAVKDICGNQFEIVRLLPPGDCPGHFDLSPGTMSQLSRCLVLFRFDFQEGLDSKLSGLASRGLRIVAVAMPAGLCVPDSYVDACRQISVALEEMYPGSVREFSARLAAVEERLSDLSSVMRTKIAAAGLRGRKVVCSQHQSSFCRWLGLEVVAQFSRPEDMTFSTLEQVIAAGERTPPQTRLIIANLQEGRQAADSIAQRLCATVILFSNFPRVDSGQQRFDDLVLSNLGSLIRGAKP